MKLLAVPLLVVLMATHAFSKWALLLEFERNRDDIAQTLCENKTKPALNCRGRCQLAKKMAASENENNAPQKPASKPVFWEAAFPLLTGGFSWPVRKAANGTLNASEKHWSPRSPLCSVFHPPPAL